MVTSTPIARPAYKIVKSGASPASGSACVPRALRIASNVRRSLIFFASLVIAYSWGEAAFGTSPTSRGRADGRDPHPDQHLQREIWPSWRPRCVKPLPLGDFHESNTACVASPARLVAGRGGKVHRRVAVV